MNSNASWNIRIRLTDKDEWEDKGALINDLYNSTVDGIEIDYYTLESIDEKTITNYY